MKDLRIIPSRPQPPINNDQQGKVARQEIKSETERIVEDLKARAETETNVLRNIMSQPLRAWRSTV